MISRLASLCVVAALGVAGTIVHSQTALSPQADKMKMATPQVGPVAPPKTAAAKIKSAMSAAPAAIANAATILDMETMKPLRQGTNGWTCLPDGPSPGVDPMCLDQNGMEWVNAWASKKEPPAGKMGLGYMLMGGSDASNTDPFATQPKSGARWVDTGPHIMVFNIGDRFAGYPTTATNTKVPYVMWSGTPYAHLMVPIR